MKRPLVAALVGGLLVILLLWYLVLFKPVSHHLSSLQGQVTNLQSQQAGLESKLASLRKAQQEEPRKQAQLAALQAQIPPTADMAGFINQVDNLASQSGVQLQALSPSLPATTPGSTLSTITVSATTAGSYSNVNSFLSGLYQLPRLVVVDALTLSGSSTGAPGSSGTLNASFKLRTFTTATPTTALK